MGVVKPSESTEKSLGGFRQKGQAHRELLTGNKLVRDQIPGWGYLMLKDLKLLMNPRTSLMMCPEDLLDVFDIYIYIERERKKERERKRTGETNRDIFCYSFFDCSQLVLTLGHCHGKGFVLKKFFRKFLRVDQLQKKWRKCIGDIAFPFLEWILFSSIQVYSTDLYMSLVRQMGFSFERCMLSLEVNVFKHFINLSLGVPIIIVLYCGEVWFGFFV